jgi:signal peptide peptidase SppA
MSDTNAIALDAALNAAWAMEPDALARLLDIAARQHEIDREALEAYRAKTLAGADRAQIRGNVAVINAIGPMFKRANLMTAISGATSYDILRRDLQAAADAGVKNLLLNVDSPGGEASGMAELAQAVFAMRDRMNIVAYVGGMGASAGYWLASAAHSIVVDPTAILGSIGVQWAMVDSAAAEEKRGVKRFTFISSQSPMKNADPGSEEGASHIQAAVDAQAQVFVETVARNRGVAIETVLTDFGKGGIFVGQQAIDAGLADSIGSFENVLAELSGSAAKTGSKGVTMADENFSAEQRDQAVASALTAERERVAGIRKLAAAHNASDADVTAAIDGNVTIAAFAITLADAATAAAAAAATAAEAEEAKRLAALKTDEETAGQAVASTGKEPGAKSADDLANEIVASAKLAAGE